MTTLVLITGVRHQIAMRLVDDLRIARSACGEWIALTGDRPDPESIYQRAVYPLAFAPTNCRECFR